MATPFFFWQKKILKRIDVEEVTRIVTNRNYLNIYDVAGKIYTVRSTLSRAIETLPQIFVPVSRSTYVSILHIDNIEKDQLLIGKQAIPIERSYYRPLIRALNVFGEIGEGDMEDTQ